MFAMYVIYDHPEDYPDAFVVRQWLLNLATMAFEPGNVLGFAPTLDNSRTLVPPGFCNIGRFAEDFPSIAEVWI